MKKVLPIAFMALIEDKNDQALFNEFVDKYERLLMTIAIKKLGDHALAEDAVFETFLKISKCFQKFTILNWQKSPDMPL